MSFTLDVDLFIHQCLCFFLGVIKNGSLVGGQMHALNTLSDFFLYTSLFIIKEIVYYVFTIHGPLCKISEIHGI